MSERDELVEIIKLSRKSGDTQTELAALEKLDSLTQAPTTPLPPAQPAQAETVESAPLKNLLTFSQVKSPSEQVLQPHPNQEDINMGMLRSLYKTGQSAKQWLPRMFDYGIVDQLQKGVTGKHMSDMLFPEQKAAIDADVAEKAREWEMATEDKPWAKGGEIAGAMAQFIAPGTGVMKAVQTAPKAAKTGLAGMYGMAEQLLTDPSTSGDFERDKAISGTVGAGAGVLGEGVAQMVGGVVKRIGGKDLVTRRTIKSALADMGVDITKVSDDQLDQMIPMINSALKNPQEAATLTPGMLDIAAGKGDVVPTTAAERLFMNTGDLSDWARQKQALEGVLGQDPRNAMTAFEEARARSIAGSVGRQADELGPLKQTTDLQAPAEQFKAGVVGKVDEVKTAARDAWGKVDTRALQAPQDTYTDAVTTLRGAFAGPGDGSLRLGPQEIYPMSHAVYKQFDDILKGTSENGLPGALPDLKQQTYDLQTFRDMKEAINAGWANAKSKDKALLSHVMRKFDGWMDDAAKSGKFVGDQTQHQLLKDAVEASKKEFGILAKRNPLGREASSSKIINKVIADEITPEEMIDDIFGATFSKKGSAATVRDFKLIFGENSEEVGALKQAAFYKLFNKALNFTDDGLEVRRGNYINAIRDRIKNNRSSLEAIFSESEIKRFDDFANALEKIKTPSNIDNPSKSGFRAAEIALDRVGGLLGDWGLAATRSISRAAGEQKAYKGIIQSELGATRFRTSPDVEKFMNAIRAGYIGGRGEL
jgi:hypothetical protein